MALNSTFTPDTKADNTIYSRYQRYARPARIRYAAQKTAFVTTQATRLGTTVAAVKNFLYGNTALQITKAASTATLKNNPFPKRSV